MHILWLKQFCINNRYFCYLISMPSDMRYKLKNIMVKIYICIQEKDVDQILTDVETEH